MVMYCVVLCSCSLRLALRDIPEDLLRKRPHIVLEEEYLMLSFPVLNKCFQTCALFDVVSQKPKPKVKL